MIFIVYGHRALSIYQNKKIENKNTNSSPFISILICAKNEENNINPLLRSLELQDYPKENIQIILVDDASDDRTLHLMNEWANGKGNVEVISIDSQIKRDLPGKKYALRLGLQPAKYEYVLLTDADCIPTTSQWISGMAHSATNSNGDILLGYGAYRSKKGLLNRFIQFETVHTAIQYFSYAILGKAYMGVGRNLMYRTELIKDAFNESEVIDAFRKTSSGDDDLMVSYNANKDKVYINPEYHAATVSEPITSYLHYLRQKSRHTSSAKFYRPSTKKLLALYAISHFGFWCSILILPFLSGCLFYVGLSVGLIILIAKALLYQRWKKILQFKLNILLVLILDFSWCIYNIILSPYIFWKNKHSWN